MSGEEHVDLSDDAFEEYLNGGSALSRAYGEIASSKVPPKVETSVLRRAHALASFRALLRTETWMRLSTPVALAACMLVMIAVLVRGVVPFMRTQAQLVMVQLGERPARAEAAQPPTPAQMQRSAPEPQRVVHARRDRDERTAVVRSANQMSPVTSNDVPADELPADEISASGESPSIEPSDPVSGRGH